jgi:hypothetical protein
MVLLGDEAQVEAQFSLFGDFGRKVDACLRRTYRRLRNLF